jgi:general secretion pathway protein L
MRSIALDIGENSVKIVDLIEHKKTIVVQSISEKKLSPLANEHDRDIEAIEFVRHYLMQVDRAKDSSPARFIMSIRQDRVTVRTKTFPFTDRLKIAKSLPFEMEDDIPFDPDNCIFDFKIISTEGSTALVLAVAVQKLHIEKCLSLAKDFGIELHSISVEGIAFANLIENWEQSPPQIKFTTNDFELSGGAPEIEIKKNVEMIIHFGHKRTLLTAFSNQRLLYVRSAIWGADNIIQELIRKFQLPYGEAQKILQNQAELLLSRQNVDFDRQNLSSTIEKPMRDLIRELQITFLEIQSTMKGHITTIYLSGGLGRLQNIAPYLTQHLEIACNPTDLSSNFLSSQTLIQSDVNPSMVDAVSAPGIALAIEGLKKPRNPGLQLIRGEFTGDSNPIKAFWEEWGRVTTTALSIALVLLVWSFFRIDFSSNLAFESEAVIKKQAGSLLRLPRKQANERGVKKYITDNKKRTLELKQVSEFTKMNSALDLMKQITESAPDRTQVNLDIKNLNVLDEKVQIEGYANSPREVTQLINKLKSIAKNQSAKQMPDSQLPTLPNRVTFRVEIDMDRGLAAKALPPSSEAGKTE